MPGFSVFAAYALICIPGILLAERGAIPIHESFFHGSQFVACVACVAMSVRFIVRSRSRTAHGTSECEPRWIRLAWVCACASGGWILLVAVAITWMATHPIPF